MGWARQDNHLQFCDIKPHESSQLARSKGTTLHELIDFAKAVKSKGKMGVYQFHGIGSPLFTVSPTVHRQFLEYLKSNQADYWVTTFSSAMDYVTSKWKKWVEGASSQQCVYASCGWRVKLKFEFLYLVSTRGTWLSFENRSRHKRGSLLETKAKNLRGLQLTTQTRVFYRVKKDRIVIFPVANLNVEWWTRNSECWSGLNRQSRISYHLHMVASSAIQDGLLPMTLCGLTKEAEIASPRLRQGSRL